MTMNRAGILAATSLTMLMANTTVAHHNWAAFYDVDGDIEIEGVISEIIWRNPHVVMYFTVDQGTLN